MEFDKSRVYTAVNADELRAGDKVILANTMANLREDVRKGINIEVLKDVHGEDCLSRFIGKEGWYPLAYLYERAENCTNCIENGGRCTPMEDDKLTRCGEYKPKENCTNCGNRGNSYCSCFTRDKSDELSRTVCGNYIRLSEQKAEAKTERHELVSFGNGQYAEKPQTETCDTCLYTTCGMKGVAQGKGCGEWKPKTEKKYRPFKDVDELFNVWCKKLGVNNYWDKGTNITMPFIWVRKKDCDSELLITGYNKPDGEVFIIDAIDLIQLFDNFTFLDGSPCGVEE